MIRLQLLVCLWLEPRVGEQGNCPCEICCMNIFFLGFISASHLFSVPEDCGMKNFSPSLVVNFIPITSYGHFIFQWPVCSDSWCFSRLFSELLCQLCFHVMHKIGIVSVMGHVRYKELWKVPLPFHAIFRASVQFLSWRFIVTIQLLPHCVMAQFVVWIINSL